MTRAPLLAVLAGGLGLVGPAVADSVLDRTYPSAKLAELWAGTLGTAAPEAARFALLAPGARTPDPAVVVTAAPDFGLPFSGVVIGESATPAGGTQMRAFPVIPMGPEDASVLNRRLAWAEIYLARYRFYESVSTDDAAVMTALTQRQYGAALEAYLITARLYFAAPDLPEKCQRLTRLGDLAAGPLEGIAEDRLPVAWRPLLPLQTATATRLGSDTLAAVVCAVQPVRGRAETIRIVETRVRERIMVEVRAKVDDTLQLLEASSTEFQALVNQMDVPIFSAEIL